MRVTSFLFIIAFVGAISCNKNNGVVVISPEEQLAKDVLEIDAYLVKNNITATKDPGGVRYVIHKEGSGTVSPGSGNCVKISYSGRKIVDDSEFEKSDAVKLCYSSVVSGFQTGLSKMQVGDSATIYIPSTLAYGKTGSPSGKIVANESIYFGISLKEIGDSYWNSALGRCSCEFESAAARRRRLEIEIVTD